MINTIQIIIILASILFSCFFGITFFGYLNGNYSDRYRIRENKYGFWPEKRFLLYFFLKIGHAKTKKEAFNIIEKDKIVNPTIYHSVK